MNIRRTVTKAVGLAQGVVGAVSFVFAYFLYHNLFDVQVMLNVSAKNLFLYMLLFIVFGLLSLASALFLIFEQ
mgnify:CR=1 FL=1